MRNTDERLAFGEPSWDDFPRPEQEQPAHFEDSMMQSVLGFVILYERRKLGARPALTNAPPLESSVWHVESERIACAQKVDAPCESRTTMA